MAQFHGHIGAGISDPEHEDILIFEPARVLVPATVQHLTLEGAIAKTRYHRIERFDKLTTAQHDAIERLSFRVTIPENEEEPSYFRKI